MFGQGLRQTYWRAAVVPHQPARAAITNSKVKATGSGSVTSATSESAGRVRTRVSANEGADVAEAVLQSRALISHHSKIGVSLTMAQMEIAFFPFFCVACSALGIMGWRSGTAKRAALQRKPST